MSATCRWCNATTFSGDHACRPGARISALEAENADLRETATRWLRVLESENLLGFITTKDLQLLEPAPGDIAAEGSARYEGHEFTYDREWPTA